METQTSGSVLAQKESTKNTQPQLDSWWGRSHWHPHQVKQTTQAEEREGQDGIPAGRKGRRNQKKKGGNASVSVQVRAPSQELLISLWWGYDWMDFQVHPQSVFPPSFLDGRGYKLCSPILFCVSVEVAQSNSFLKGQPLFRKKRGTTSLREGSLCGHRSARSPWDHPSDLEKCSRPLGSMCTQCSLCARSWR